MHVLLLMICLVALILASQSAGAIGNTPTGRAAVTCGPLG